MTMFGFLANFRVCMGSISFLNNSDIKIVIKGKKEIYLKNIYIK